MSSLTYENGSLVVVTPYNPGLVQELKARIPYTERSFDKARRAWLVDPRWGQDIAKMIAQYCGEFVMVPQVNGKVATNPEIFDVRYIGSCKERAPGEYSAYGWVNGKWSVVFPEAVLREWFEGKPVTPTGHTNAATLYGILGITQQATADDLKAAYRRMARQWHPDVCKEPDAEERFKRINEAYQMLNDPGKRAKYDMGLALEASLSTPPMPAFTYQSAAGYRSPLLCGLILAEARPMLGRYVVEKILAWEDITNAYGNILVVSWPAGADIFQERWV